MYDLKQFNEYLDSNEFSFISDKIMIKKLKLMLSVFENGPKHQVEVEAFVEKYPNTKIITYAPELFAANSILEDKVYSYTHKNIFEDWIKHSTFLSPEPYQNKNYYNQKIHLTQAFA